MIRPSRYSFSTLFGILGLLEKYFKCDHDTRRYKFTRPRSFFAMMMTWYVGIFMIVSSLT